MQRGRCCGVGGCGQLLGWDSFGYRFFPLDLQRISSSCSACSGQEAPLLRICSFTCLPCCLLFPGGEVRRRVSYPYTGCLVVRCSVGTQWSFLFGMSVVLSGAVACRLRWFSFWLVLLQVGLRREVVYGLGSGLSCGASCLSSSSLGCST